jgi:ribosomal protein S12 methylthiotransferase accessory factor
VQSVSDTLFLFSEGRVETLRAPGIDRLLPLLDGTRDRDEVVAHPAVDGPRAAALVDALLDHGLLTVGRAAAGAELAYWDAAGVDAEATAPLRDGGRTGLTVLADVDPDAVAAGLRAAGVPGLELSGTAGPAGTDLDVVLTDDYLDPRLAAVAAAHRASGTPWLLARPDGRRVWLGPVFTGEGACWHCLAHRLWLRRSRELAVAEQLGRPGLQTSPRLATAATRTAALALVAHEALKWLSGCRSAQDAVWTLDTVDLAGARHPVTRRPQCPACGDPDLVTRRGARPVTLRARDVVVGGGGGYRVEPAEATLERLQHLVSPVTGLVPRLDRVPTGPAFFNSWSAGPATWVSGSPGQDGTAPVVRSAWRSVNGGKGVTAVQAQVSALCEAVERTSGFRQGDETVVRGSLTSLAPEAVDPDAVQLVDAAQFADRDVWNRSHSTFNRIPEQFDPDAVVDWTPVWSLTHGRRRLLPTDLLYYGGSTPGTAADSNGTAAGTCLEDAVLQALFELVERDALAQWWYNRLRLPAVDLGSTGDPWVTQLRQVHAELGREVWALDLTSDLGIPVVAALSRCVVPGAPEAVAMGFGAHTDGPLALRRALTELNQVMPLALDPATSAGDPDLRAWWASGSVAANPYLLPDPAEPVRRLPSDGRPAPLDEHVHALVERLRGHDLEVLVLDQTRPDLGVCVVRVVVPGLRSPWARFAPGRLFDVPVRRGLLPRPTAPADLNPVPFFL